MLSNHGKLDVVWKENRRKSKFHNQINSLSIEMHKKSQEGTKGTFPGSLTSWIPVSASKSKTLSTVVF